MLGAVACNSSLTTDFRTCDFLSHTNGISSPGFRFSGIYLGFIQEFKACIVLLMCLTGLHFGLSFGANLTSYHYIGTGIISYVANIPSGIPRKDVYPWLFRPQRWSLPTPRVCIAEVATALDSRVCCRLYHIVSIYIVYSWESLTSS